MFETKVISLGGSIVAPDQVDTAFLKDFRNLTLEWLEERSNRRLILIIGGGGPARRYQEAYRLIKGDAHAEHEAQDWIGIRATRLNAELVKAVFGDLCPEPIVTNPGESHSFEGKILVGAGWKPGFSTDYDAVLLAEKYGADTVINLSNIAQVYTDDPKTNPEAQALESVSWADFRRIVGDHWIPGRNLPFDPVASRKGEEMNLTVVCAGGRDISNTAKILRGKPFFGTQIGPR